MPSQGGGDRGVQAAYYKAMKPHLDAVHKNCSNANIYFAAGGKVVEVLGKKKTN